MDDLAGSVQVFYLSLRAEGAKKCSPEHPARKPLEQLARRGSLPAALDALPVPSPVFFHLYAPSSSNIRPDTL